LEGPSAIALYLRASKREREREEERHTLEADSRLAQQSENWTKKAKRAKESKQFTKLGSIFLWASLSAALAFGMEWNGIESL